MTERSSVDPAEVAKFAALADQWWDPSGTFAPLHRFNPVRLGFIQAFAANHFAVQPGSLAPFEGLTLLDVGCGGGLLAEPMARLGFAVCGIDASEKNIGVATAHATLGGLDITYRATTAEALAETETAFDVVLNMEVVEHIADLRTYLTSCAKLVRPGGLMFVATLNKTFKSWALAKVGAEYILGWLPIGTHDWERFIGPSRLGALLAEAGLHVLKSQGIAFDPLSWNWRLSTDLDVNYMLAATRPVRPPPGSGV
ncbi:MAG TPA: bifunctional 2-polyprenyl-6-hydroxyphenol methylase/3-demethylubiquinol 3-O-methyltransferase UbiG [Rhizomicrobium sp.]|nr:bifunctional 2-polyprenyl-6-hydroxyphenol methylase/3-demethylubiquinol 3-O-methyltransferase UbiG [Rhizomicrobium sp.]